MKQWILKQGVYDLHGLTMVDAAMPEPGPGEVRVRVRAVSLNFRDQIVLKDAHWRVPDHDLVPVSDGAGEIDALGEGVEGWAVGDMAVGLSFKNWLDGPPSFANGMGVGALNDDGVLAEYVVLPVTQIVKAPRGYSFAEAATLPIAAVTAWNALYGDRPIGPDSKVLVLGTGGVALYALQFAQAAGAHVVATSSQDAKLERLKALGATTTINYRSHPEWGQAVLEATGGVDKVVDSVGMLNHSLTAVAPLGEIALFGMMGSDGPPNPMLWLGKSISIRGIVVGNARQYGDLLAAIEQHDIHPPLDDHFRFAFENAPAAYEAQSSPDLFGKIVIDVA